MGCRSCRFTTVPLPNRWFFLVGVQHLDLDDLNDRLAAHSYPALPGSMLSLGGGGWAVRGRLMVGGEGHALIGSAKTTSDGTYKSRLTAGYGMLDLGYSVYDRDRFEIYPMLGDIGPSGVEVVGEAAPAHRLADVERGPAAGHRVNHKAAGG